MKWISVFIVNTIWTIFAVSDGFIFGLHLANVVPNTADATLTPSDNIFSYRQIVVSSFDPNNKNMLVKVISSSCKQSVNMSII
jgi:hypothetical protein